jgi:monoamine oxidase
MTDALTADVAIVGAGVTGIHVAAELERLLPGARVLVLEADEQPGGRVRAQSIDVGGRVVHADVGAHYLGGRHRRLGALAERFSPGERYDNLSAYGKDPGSRARLAGRWRLTTRSTVFLDIHGLTKDCPPSDVLAIFRSLSLFMSLEKLVNVERPWDTPLARELDALTFQEWIDAQNLPRWIVEMWQIASLGIITSHARDISMLWWLWYNASNLGLMTTSNDYEGCPQEFSLHEGLGTLVQRYAKSLRCELRTRTPVVAIDHSAPDHVALTLKGGVVVRARHVVVAATPRAVGRNITFSPQLSAERRELHAQPTGHAVKAVAYYAKPWWWNAHGGMHMNSFMTAPEDSGIEWALDTSCEKQGLYSLMMFVSDRLIDRARGGSVREAVIDAAVELTGDARARDVLGFALYDWRDNPWVGGGPNTVMRPGLLSRLGGVLGEPERPHRRLHFASSEQSVEFTGYIEGGLAIAERVAEGIAESMVAQRERRAPRSVEQPARTPVRGTDGARALALGAGYAALTPAWVARPVLDRMWRLLRNR